MVGLRCVSGHPIIARLSRAGFLQTCAASLDALRCGAGLDYRLRHDAGDYLPSDRHFHRFAVRSLQRLRRPCCEQRLADAGRWDCRHPLWGDHGCLQRSLGRVPRDPLHRRDPSHHGDLARGTAMVARRRVRQQSSGQFPVVRPWSAGGTIHDHRYRCSSLPLPCICAQVHFRRPLCLCRRLRQRGREACGHPSSEGDLCGFRSHGCAHGTRGAAERGPLSRRGSQSGSRPRTQGHCRRRRWWSGDLRRAEDISGESRPAFFSFPALPLPLSSCICSPNGRKRCRV